MEQESNENERQSPSELSLLDGLEQAYLLLRYVSTRGISLEKNIVDAIVNAKAAIANGVLSTAEESDFWLALRQLSTAAHPVSIQSIRAIDPQFAEPIRKFPFFWKADNCTEAEIASSNFRWFTLAAMSLLLIAQLYWLVAINIFETNESIQKELDIVATQISELSSQSQTGSAEELSLALTPLEEREEELFSQQVVYLSIQEVISFSNIGSPVIDSASPLEQARNKTSISALYLRNLLYFLSLFVLPLLYGLLGACIYVMRELATDIQTVSFSAEKLLQYRLRLLLGTLAGLMIVWLLNVNVFIELLEFDELSNAEAQEDVWKRIGPFALAFITGYSVEIFFSALDRFVAAFSSKK